MKVQQVTGAFGGCVTGIDVSQPLPTDVIGGIKKAIDQLGVLFFPDQPVLTAEKQLALTAQFGEVETPPFLTKYSQHPQVLIVEFEKPKGAGADIWHQDGTHTTTPPIGTFLQAHILPAFGGDACFSCMYSAYDALSPALRHMLDGLTARHSTANLFSLPRSPGQYGGREPDAQPPVSHPVVTANPRTGRRRLFVNRLYTIAIEGMPEAESRFLLDFLFEHIKSPEFQLRYSWKLGDLAFWDNQAVQHFAVADYTQQRRMQRVTLAGEKPIGAERQVQADEAA